jgi:squalene synthase HpnC
MSSLTLPANRYRVDRTYSLEEARAYCARLATSHYENFLVATLFVPKHLKQHFHHVYAYCRIADDLGDESGGPQNALPLLDWWQEELDLCFAGAPRHPVFTALAETNRLFDIPKDPYANLLKAFRQDQTVFRYPTYADLLGYCENSANPVGRLVLYLCGYRDSARQELSDKTCTALQLANFWQDVSRDYAIGRIYLPQEDIAHFGVTEDQIAHRRFSPQFGAMLEYECGRTLQLFEEGLKLVEMVDRRLRLDIDMFSQGGLEILRRIKAQQYDVLTRRPSIPKSRQFAILIGRLLRGAAHR